MLTGVSYMGHHNPKHIKTDLEEMKELQLDDVLVAAQENDFVHFPGKLKYLPEIAKDLGIRPIAIFWGVINLFGGGRSSQFLLEHPEGFQVKADGSHSPLGCYVNPVCVVRIKEMIDTVAEHGFEGYFVDEPTELKNCYCASCRSTFDEWYGGDLTTADEDVRNEFRQRCVMDYVREISDYCKANHPQLETICCLMPHQTHLWPKAAEIENLDNLGTDIYLVNRPNDVEDMTPLVREMASLCKENDKVHHEWLQCWFAKTGNEDRILQQGKILVREQPDAMYIWAWQAQIGVDEACDDPALSWSKAVEILRMAKE